MKSLLIILTLLMSVNADEIESENIFSNTNFIQYAKSDDASYSFDYNRFRFENRSYIENFSSLLILDNDTIVGSKYLNDSKGTPHDSTLYNPDIPFNTSIKLGSNPYDRVKIYRALAKYEDDEHALTFGLQRVAFGVGRVWTPTDMFNPLQSLSLESAERSPVFALDYNNAFSDTGSLELVTSIQENNDLKAAIRIKEYVLFADMGLIIVKEKNRQLLGFEIEGHLLETGVEVRSEGGIFTNTKADKSFTKFILGADYGFENSLILTAEYLYNENDYKSNQMAYPSFGDDTFTNVIAHKDSNYMALMASYSFSTLISGSLLGMYNLEDESSIFIPTFLYSLSDESTLNIGGFIGIGSSGSEFKETPNLLFASVSITF